MPDLRGRDELEKKIEAALKRSGRRHLPELMRLLGNPPDADNVPAAFWRKINADLNVEMRTILAEVYTAGAEQMQAALPQTVDWQQPNVNAMAWAATYSYELVTGVTATMRDKFQTYVTDFFKEPTTLGDLRGRIAPEVPDLVVFRKGVAGILTSEQRAVLIARTEVTRAAVEGELSIIRQIDPDGTEMIAIWNTRNDDLVCPVCGPRNQKPQGDGWDDVPPAHPNCRCWLNHEVRFLWERRHGG